jgi:NTE family protein
VSGPEHAGEATTAHESLIQAVQPVRRIPGDPAEDQPSPGIALCLSGGGYRAMLFHVGTLWRLNQLGCLPRLDRVSSVSGGSITAGILARNWSQLAFGPDGVAGGFQTAVVDPLRAVAGTTIDLPAIAKGALLPGSISDRIAASYRRHLFGSATLQNLPDSPRFVINATNLQSGVLWRFSKPYMADYRVGSVPNPTIPIAVAVAASSAFPPMLSPLELELDESQYGPLEGTDLTTAPYRTRPVLSDGGVYDNLGLETAWKRYRTVLISDGGGHFAASPKVARNWPQQAVRVNGVIDGQVRALRKRQAVGGFKAGLRDGAYWSIWSHVADYELPDALDCPPDRTLELARVPTRLGRLDAQVQERLINWGYAICDTAMRKHVEPQAARPSELPYPQAGI